MTGIDELLKLEETVIEATKTISLLGKERDQWRLKYQELVQKVKNPEEKTATKNADMNNLVSILEEENKALKSRIKLVIQQTEVLRAEIVARLND